MSTRRSITLGFFICSLIDLAAGLIAAEPPVGSSTNPIVAKPDDATPEKGLRIGNRVPISSMRYIDVDRNGCYAGQFSKYRAISIYARSIDEPGLGDLARLVDARLKENDQLRGYIVVLKGDQFNEGLKADIRKWIKDQQLTHVKLAIANGTTAFGIADETGIQIVDSDKRLVKYSQAFPAGKLDDMALKRVGDAVK